MESKDTKNKDSLNSHIKTGDKTLCLIDTYPLEKSKTQSYQNSLVVFSNGQQSFLIERSYNVN